eukprot:360121-Chlamydomonas_euryale.AAC.25
MGHLIGDPCVALGGVTPTTRHVIGYTWCMVEATVRCRLGAQPCRVLAAGFRCVVCADSAPSSVC